MTKSPLLLALGAFAFSGTLLMTSGCSDSTTTTATAAKPLNDGEVTLPGDYANWPKFVDTVVKPNGQIREIYINAAGMEAKKGGAFAYGTVAVMELYKSRKGDSGELIKDGLEKVFVMEKGQGFGQNLPSGSAPTGEWAYGAYLADKSTAATNDFAGCRGCHAPLGDDDFMPRYAEHFAFKQ